jgi:tRNA G18 (ribose-2'-O)-methylase SpoU
MINVTGELNVGMALRSASLLGAENFYIFGRKKFDARSTVGAENYINIVQYSYDDPMTADEHILAELRELNKTHSVILCEHGGYMLSENDFGWAYEERPSPVFIFGSESHGIPKLITDQVASDGYPEYEFERISIPQRGVLRSFNVSAAMAIVCWDYIREWKL